MRCRSDQVRRPGASRSRISTTSDRSAIALWRALLQPAPYATYGLFRRKHQPQADHVDALNAGFVDRRVVVVDEVIRDHADDAKTGALVEPERIEARVAGTHFDDAGALRFREPDCVSKQPAPESRTLMGLR